jgi:hypothetical protein
MKNRLPHLALAVLLTAALACKLELNTGTPLSPDQVDTFSAQTLAMIAWQTQMAQGTVAPPPVADTPAPPPGGDTPAPPAPTDSPTGTTQPTATWTGTQPPTYTFTPSATLTPLPCNWAQFVTDVTIADNWETTPADHFTKTWRLKNIGSCTWTSGYSLIFDHGDQMGAPAAQQLTPGTVAPGQTIDVSVNLLSPNIAGTYQGFFKLRASDSTIFGIGADHNTAFWVKIVVQAVLGPPAVAPVTHYAYTTMTVPADGTGNKTAECPSGSVVTGGGFNANTNIHMYTQLMSGNGWTVFAKNNAGTPQNVIVYAICLSLPSTSSAQKYQSVSVLGGGGQTTNKVDCNAGTYVVGGGFNGKINGTLWTFFSAQSGNSWSVTTKNYDPANTTFGAYAVCLTSATPVVTASVTGYQDVAPGATGLAEIACPAGQVVTGGGWNLDADLKVFAALMSSGGEWRVYAKNNGTHTRALQARATCLGLA